jgi:hypothetical protein
MPCPTTLLALQPPAGRALRIASRVRALAACVAVTASTAWPAAAVAQLVTLLPTDGSSLLATAAFESIRPNIVNSGQLQTPRSEASATASSTGIGGPNIGAYTVWSSVNAIQTVTEDSASRFAMSFYSGSTYSVSALSIEVAEAHSAVTWLQRLSLATESNVVLTHVSTPRFAGETGVATPRAELIFSSLSAPGFSPLAGC